MQPSEHRQKDKALRRRGDGPAKTERIAHNRAASPHTRDGPQLGIQIALAETASPHTRGWTRRVEQDAPRVNGFPAHAGMDPIILTPAASVARLPRTRGDGPQIR